MTAGSGWAQQKKDRRPGAGHMGLKDNVFRLVLGTIVCLFTARIDCFSLFFFNVFSVSAAMCACKSMLMPEYITHVL
jgi:hypothetical protein